MFPVNLPVVEVPNYFGPRPNPERDTVQEFKERLFESVRRGDLQSLNVDQIVGYLRAAIYKASTIEDLSKLFTQKSLENFFMPTSQGTASGAIYRAQKNFEKIISTMLGNIVMMENPGKLNILKAILKIAMEENNESLQRQLIEAIANNCMEVERRSPATNELINEFRNIISGTNGYEFVTGIKAIKLLENLLTSDSRPILLFLFKFMGRPTLAKVIKSAYDENREATSHLVQNLVNLRPPSCLCNAEVNSFNSVLSLIDYERAQEEGLVIKLNYESEPPRIKACKPTIEEALELHNLKAG